MLKQVLGSLLLILCMGFSQASYAKDGESADGYAYYGFEPDIVTNYISEGKKIGFIRVTMEIMVKSSEHIAIIEHHSPLLRAEIVEILGSKSEEQVKSVLGKKEIRDDCFEVINELLKRETGQELAVSLLFTKYIYH